MYAAKNALAQYQKIDQESAVDGASPHRLIQLLMTGALERLSQARMAMEQGDIPRKGMMLGKAVGIIGGLQSSLDRDQAPEVVDNLDALYDYMQRRLLEANLRNDPAIIDEVRELMGTVKSGWDEIAPVASAG